MNSEVRAQGFLNTACKPTRRQGVQSLVSLSSKFQICPSMAYANRDAGSDNGYGNPKPGAAGFSYPSRRPLMSRTSLQVAFIQALFGDEPFRSYRAQFIPPHLLSNNGSNESARANEGQNHHSSPFASDSSRPDGYERTDVEVTNAADAAGEPDEVRKEEVSIRTSQEDRMEDEACLALILAAARDIEKGVFPKRCLLDVELPACVC